MDTDWHNDQVTRAAVRDEVARVLGKQADGIDRRRSCTGPCNQGRSPCQSPQACEIAEPTSKEDMIWIYACIGTPLVLVLLGVLVGWWH